MAAWAILVALAAFQAYAQRFVIGPDGISYLDLSDAVVTGNWSRLLNLYWSPLYPALIGAGRAITGVGAQNEIPLVHAVNVVCVVAMVQAIVMTIRAVRHGSMGVWTIALLLIIPIAAIGATYFYRRAMSLHREATANDRADAPVGSPPDFSKLGDGSDQWKRLEDVR